VELQRLFALHNQILGSVISVADWLTNFEALGEHFQCVERNQVCLLLLVLGVDEKSPAGHGAHVTEFAAHVDVDCLVAELLRIAFYLELVHVEAVA
jgi:hypothetical protein